MVNRNLVLLQQREETLEREQADFERACKHPHMLNLGFMNAEERKHVRDTLARAVIVKGAKLTPIEFQTVLGQCKTTIQRWRWGIRNAEMRAEIEVVPKTFKWTRPKPFRSKE